MLPFFVPLAVKLNFTSRNIWHLCRLEYQRKLACLILKETSPYLSHLFRQSRDKLLVMLLKMKKRNRKLSDCQDINFFSLSVRIRKDKVERPYHTNGKYFMIEHHECQGWCAPNSESIVMPSKIDCQEPYLTIGYLFQKKLRLN